MAKRGVALLLVVFIVFFLALFVIGFSYLAATDFQIARNDKFSTKALYVAEAGIERGIRDLKVSYGYYYAGLYQVGFPDDLEGSVQSSYYTVPPIVITDPEDITVDSTGTVITKDGTEFKRKVEANVDVDSDPAVINSWREETP